jgi:hypothetical protein
MANSISRLTLGISENSESVQNRGGAVGEIRDSAAHSETLPCVLPF